MRKTWKKREVIYQNNSNSFISNITNLAQIKAIGVGGPTEIFLQFQFSTRLIAPFKMFKILFTELKNSNSSLSYCLFSNSYPKALDLSRKL